MVWLPEFQILQKIHYYYFFIMELYLCLAILSILRLNDEEPTETGNITQHLEEQYAQKRLLVKRLSPHRGKKYFLKFQQTQQRPN